jgi:prepilin-type processing-associated H-X9-DG protein
MEDFMEDNDSLNSKIENNEQGITGDQNTQKSALTHLPKWYHALLACLTILPLLGPFALGLLIPLIVTLILGILSLRRIRRSNGTLSDNGYVVPAIVTPIVILVVAAIAMPAISYAAGRIFSGDSWTLELLGGELADYAKNHDGQFPETEKWCDALIDSSEIKESDFGYRGSEDKSSDYAINKHAVELGADIPDNMVLLFESESGWNQAGGIELLRKDGRGRVNILFADNHIETVRAKHAPYLRWKLEDSGVIPEPDIAILFAVGGVIVAIVFGWICVHLKNYAKKYWKFALGLGIVSAGVGVLFGIGGEMLHIVGDKKGLGWVIGGITGLLVGISYVSVLARCFEMKKPEVSIVGYGALSGMIAGAVCSTIVHAFLMIGYDEMNFVNMIVGSIFGIWAGAILGWISSGIIFVGYGKTLTINVTADNMEI